MFCPKCGTNIDGVAKYCPKCGNDLSEYLDDRSIAETTDESDEPPYIEGEETDNSSHIVKPKRKKRRKRKAKHRILTRVLIGTAIIAVAILGVFVCTKVIRSLFSGNEYYVVLSDDKYEITKNPKKDANIELSSAQIEHNSDAYVRFSPDKKYVYFYTKVKEDNTGTLCRAEISKLKKNSSKNDKYIETIDSKVHVGFKFFRNGSLVYKKSGRSLYFYDGEESVLLDRNVDEVETDHESRLVYCVEQDSDYSTPYRFDIYGVDIKDVDNKIKIASDAHEIRKIDDFDNIFFEKCDNDYTPSLYTAGFNKETVKIADNASYVDSWGDIVIYSKETGELDPFDYIIDDAPEDIYYDSIRYEIRESEPPKLLTLFKYVDGESTVIEENVVNSIDSRCGLLCYQTEDMVEGKLDIDEYEELWNLFRCDYSKATYILTSNPDNKLELSAKAADDLFGAEDTNWPIFFSINKNIYFINNNELWSATVKEGEITGTVAVADGVYSVGHDDSSLYYISGQGNSNYVDVCRITDGEATRIAQDVMVYDYTLYEDGSIIGYTDINSYSDDFCGDIALFDSNGEKQSVGTDVTDYVRKKPTEILFISEGNLYSFDGKEKEQLQNNVDRVWCSKTMKKNDTISY